MLLSLKTVLETVIRISDVGGSWTVFICPSLIASYFLPPLLCKRLRKSTEGVKCQVNIILYFSSDDSCIIKAWYNFKQFPGSVVQFLKGGHHLSGLR